MSKNLADFGRRECGRLSRRVLVDEDLEGRPLARQSKAYGFLRLEERREILGARVRKGGRQRVRRHGGRHHFGEG